MITDKYYFIRLFGFSLNLDKNKYALVIGYERYADRLDQYLELNKLDWSEKHRLIRKIVTILKILHERPIILNNYSPKNILVCKNNIKSISIKFSIFAGFGLENNIAYTAPEVLQTTERKNDQSSNIYALGMIFYKIIFGREPFADIIDESQLTNEIINNVRPHFLHDIPYFLKELILKCLDADPSNRPTIHELENILLQNSIYEFQYYNFTLNDDKQEFQNVSCISEKFFKDSLDISNSFQLCKFIK
jgi:serine/threonine protein kinase